MLLDSHTHIVPFQFQMLLWDSIDAFYFGGGYVSAGLQNLLVSRHWHLFFFFLFQLLCSHQPFSMNLLQASSFRVSIMDTTIIITWIISSTAFHKFGHAIAAARYIHLICLCTFFVRCAACCLHVSIKCIF